MGVLVPLVGLAIQVGGGLYEAKRARDARHQARGAAQFEQDKMEAAQQDFQQRQAQQDEQESAQAGQEMARQRAIASGYQRASQTNFTSPLGMPGGAQTTGGGSLLGL